MASAVIKVISRKEDRKLLLVLVLIAVAALSAIWLLTQEVRVHLLKEQAVGSATKWALFLATRIEGLEELLETGELTEENAQALEFAARSGDVFRYKMFDPAGVITVASRSSDLGNRNEKPYFASVVQKGETFVKIAENDEFDEDQRVVSEAYVPIMTDGVFRGAVEVYVDMTPKDTEYRTIGSYFFWGMTGLLIVVGLGWASVVQRNFRDRDAREKALMDTQAELGTRLSELQDARERVEAEAVTQVALAEELSMARDEADAANKAKSQFLATMSHEIRTPMNGVLGMLGILSDTELSDQQLKYTKLAQESAESLLSIIDDILDYSKLEEGRIDLERVDYNPEHVIDGVVSLLSSKATDVGLTLETEGTDALPTCLRGDPTRVRQILFNLIGNAVKFTEQGGVRVIATHKELPDGEIEIRVDVKDTGVGISHEAQGRLFTRFSQADSSTTRRFGGSGLGLVICRQLAQLMGGGVGLHSEVGKGSTFWFTIRCSMGEAPVEQLRKVSGTGQGENLPKLHILVAEDNTVNQLVAKTILTKAGHDVEVVENGLKAVKAVSKGAFDVVLMDIQMPEMDGPTATREIRGLPGPASDTQIIALTANAMAGHREEYLAAGMNDYVAKPVDPKQLFAALTRVIKNRPVDALARASETEIEGGETSGPVKETTAGALDDGQVSAKPSDLAQGVTELPTAVPEADSPRVPTEKPSDDTEIDESECDVTSALPLFDREKFDELREALGDDGLQEALGFVPAEASKSLAEIKSSIASGDLETAQRAAHSIKGMASNFGAVRLQDIAREIENETPDIASVTEKLADLEDVLAQTQSEIELLKSA